MPAIDLTATIDPVLAEHYPGRGLRALVSSNAAGYEVHTGDGRRIAVEPGAIEGACRGILDGWDRLFDTLDHAFGIPLAPREFVEVPVTRRARVTRIGRVLAMGASRWSSDGQYPTGTAVVLRPDCPGSQFRTGIGRVMLDMLDLTAIPAAVHGALLYRVEPE
jgi:hypothetical protein